MGYLFGVQISEFDGSGLSIFLLAKNDAQLHPQGASASVFL